MDTASVRRMMGVLIPELFHLDSELADREGWTCLMDAFEFTVADDLGIGIVLFQRDEQREEGLFLGRGTGVGSTAFLVEATLVADSGRPKCNCPSRVM